VGKKRDNDLSEAMTDLLGAEKPNYGKNGRERKVKRKKAPSEFDTVDTTKGRGRFPLALDGIPFEGVPEGDDVDSDHSIEDDTARRDNRGQSSVTN
jgi:hypothetical protein